MLPSLHAHFLSREKNARGQNEVHRRSSTYERFHRTVLNEFYRVAFRRKIYSTIGNWRSDLDDWLRDYDEVQTRQGRWC